MLQNGHLVHGMAALLTSYGMYSQSLNEDFGNHHQLICTYSEPRLENLCRAV